ncbi:RNHCP domain-containing protein [Patescibacteria group bacterium]|nr:RNHCP domain-containing protein [Patescibacteria group bacterium]HOM77885.1 RNHCP domain-containing protein [bacterium]
MSVTESFVCKKCGSVVFLKAPGTRNRNHCPYCLYSLHVDQEKGDRASQCRGLMAPIGKFYKSDGEEMLVHKCRKCGFVRWNRVAGDDLVEAVDGLKLLDNPNCLV